MNSQRKQWARRRPQPALVVALVALIAATGGSAVALPGSSSVDGNDLKKNAVRSKTIRNGQVKGLDIARDAITAAKIADGTVGGAEIADGSVGGAEIAQGGVTAAQIADGTVGASELAPTEPYHTIGAPGEPRFSDGGEGDCIWKNGLENAPGTAPPGFAKDALGRVRLRGVLTATNGPGGDSVCDSSQEGEAEDGLVFALPPGYRPGFFDISGLAHAIVIAPDAGAELNGSAIPAGGVQSVLAANAVLDGVTIEAATGTRAAAGTRAKLSLQTLRRLAH